MKNDVKNSEMNQGGENEVTTWEKVKRFFLTWFWDKPIAGYQHTVKNLWLYITIIGLAVGGYFFNVLIEWTGSLQNASWTLFGIASVTGALWLWKIDALGAVLRHLRKNWYWYSLASLIAFFVLYIFEGALLHQYIMVLREYSFLVFFIPVMIFIFKLLVKKETKTLKGKVFVVSLAILVTSSIAGYLYLGGQQYVAKYFKYQSLNNKIVWLDEKPETFAERVFPRDVYRSILDQAIGGTRNFSNPDLVIEDGRTKFYSSVTPFKRASRFIKGKVSEIAQLPADTANIDIDEKEILKPVKFAVGEGLVWSREINNYVVKSLHWRYFNVFPTNTQLLEDDKGEYVLVTSLAQWKGWFFPTPEFYGVAIVRQGDIPWAKRAIIGGAEIIKVSDIKNYKWLLGQNLNSEISTKYAASSLAFRNGFWAPARFIQDNSLVVTDMPGDRNELPMVSGFDFNNSKKLYDFYELKSSRSKSGNADTYFWYPSDGQGTIYGYKPKSVVSMSELALKVSKDNEADTNKKFKFAEPRPFFKKGLPEMFIVSRVLKRRDGSFDPSGIKTYLINAKGIRNKFVEVPTYDRSKWLDMAKELSH